MLVTASIYCITYRMIAHVTVARSEHASIRGCGGSDEEQPQRNIIILDSWLPVGIPYELPYGISYGIPNTPTLLSNRMFSKYARRYYTIEKLLPTYRESCLARWVSSGQWLPCQPAVGNQPKNPPQRCILLRPISTTHWSYQHSATVPWMWL